MSAANDVPAAVSACAAPASPRQTTLALGALRTLTRTVSSSRSTRRLPGDTDDVSYASTPSVASFTTGGFRCTGCSSRTVSAPATATIS